MPLEQCFHLLLELHGELTPVTPVLSMDEKGSKQVDVLDVQPAAAACEQIATAVFEWQLGLHKTLFARFLPPTKIWVEVPLCIVEHQTSPARVRFPFRKGPLVMAGRAAGIDAGVEVYEASRTCLVTHHSIQRKNTTSWLSRALQAVLSLASSTECGSDRRFS